MSCVMENILTNFKHYLQKFKEGIENGYILDEQAECDMFSLS